MNLFKLDIKYNNNLLNINTDILTGNILYKLFDTNIEIANDDYEIFSINQDTEYLKNILNIMNESDNKICCFNNDIYVTEDLKNILDLIKSNKYSLEYNQYLLKSCMKSNDDIFESIDKLDLEKFNAVHKIQYNLIKKIHHKQYLPINYCFYKLKHTKNKIAKDIILQMSEILSNYTYELEPCIFDLENVDNYKNQSFFDISSYLDYWIENNNYLLCRYLTIFQINYTNKDFIFCLLKHENKINKILELIKEKKIYDSDTYLKLLLVLNKVNFFIEQNSKITIDNTFLSSIIYFDAKISFYYLLENYFNSLIFDKIILKDDFLKIYLYFVKLKDTKDIILNEYLLNLVKLDKLDYNIVSILELIDNYDLKLITEIIYLLINDHKNNTIIKDIFKINTKLKSIIQTQNILFKVLDNNNEELFYYLIGLFDNIEYDELFNNLLDEELNTLYHYICKNNICLGFKINNKNRNKKGFKPLDLCKISKKFYK